ncbi:hypothetical protein IAR50_000012 [Cryptococcus sp. DSM 104548]
MLFGNVLSLLAVAGYVSANGLNLDLGVKVNVGVGLDLRLGAPSDVRDQCSNKGDFLSELLGKVFCCSDDNRTDPEDGLTCPKGWSMHKEEKCCIPPTETDTCDCGEGYTYNEKTKKCDQNQGTCPDGQWWHERSGRCLGNDPAPSDPPQGTTCPDGFVYSGDCCVPTSPDCPEPSCDNWNAHSNVCGGTSPSERALAARHTGILYGANSFKARQLAY